MNSYSSSELLGNRTILIVDRNAGVKSGHHAHWFQRLTSTLETKGIRYQMPIEQLGDELLENKQWYENAILRCLKSSGDQMVFTAGDDVILSVFRHMWKIRRSGKPFHLFLFRMARQPNRFGAPILAMKMAMLMLLKVCARNCQLYVLQLPIGTPPRWHRWLGLIPVLDSSAVEVGALVGKPVSRQIFDRFLPAGNQVLLVIGMLGPGKHVDTLVDAWQSSRVPGTSLVFAGEASQETHALLVHASAEIPSVCYIPGRLTDEDFDRMIEGADAVVSLYRYSASSGVVLRALAMGTKVLVGGSTIFARQLINVSGVHLMDRITVSTVGSSLGEVLRMPVAPPINVNPVDPRFFPGPIVAGIRRQEV